jgi:hypothetical protein
MSVLHDVVRAVKDTSSVPVWQEEWKWVRKDSDDYACVPARNSATRARGLVTTRPFHCILGVPLPTG